MKNNLEQLLNMLIQRGWKPYGINYYCSFNIRERIELIGGPFGGGEYMLEKIPSLRELVSKESGLWQFVCENGIIKKLNIDRGEVHNWDNPNHWLCESALKDESELEEFLLQNIKVNEKE